MEQYEHSPYKGCSRWTVRNNRGASEPLRDTGQKRQGRDRGRKKVENGKVEEEEEEEEGEGETSPLRLIEDKFNRLRSQPKQMFNFMVVGGAPRLGTVSGENGIPIGSLCSFNLGDNFPL